MVLILDGDLEHDVHVCGKKKDFFFIFKAFVYIDNSRRI